MTSRATVEIKNKKGLHARAAAKLVKIVAAGASQVTVRKEGDETEVSGSSILGIMMLGADAGSKLHLTAEGKDAAQVIKALTELIDSKFGESE